MQLIDALESALPLLDEKDVTFAASLVKQWHERGHLSAKQQYWVRVMVKKAGLDPAMIEAQA